MIDLMYFVILGKNKELSLEEIKNCIGENNIINRKNDILILNENIDVNCISKLAGIVKRGILLNNLDDVKEIFLSSGKKLLGTNSIEIAKTLKNEGFIRRFKIVNIFHTDLEVKNKGIEIIKYDNLILYVKGYQNIKIYELIDFQKPVRSMKIGMMPSKLANLMINLITDCKFDGQIWDPFCGLGTILFLADWLGFEKVRGSDINTSPAKQNLKWWEKNFKKDSKIKIFKYDVLSKFNKFFLKDVNWIVTEGYLGPIINQKISIDLAKIYENQVGNLYLNLFKNVLPAFNSLKGIIFCLPVYELKSGRTYIFEDFLNQLNIIASKFNFNVKTLSEIYKRKNQKLGRQIVILKRDN